MSTIGFYVHHHGSGHLTRAVEIARACTSRVVGYSTLPRPPAWPGRWVRLVDDAAAPGPEAEPTAGGVLHWAPLGDHPYPRRMRDLAAALSQDDPDLLFVDVSVEVTLLARLLGVPVAVSAMRGDRSDPPHRLAYDVARVLVAPYPPHLPEPGTPPHVRAKTVHVGGISRFDDRAAAVANPVAVAPEQSLIPDLPHADRDRPSEASSTPRRRVFALWGTGGGDWPDAVWERIVDRTPGWTWVRGAAPQDVWSRLREADVVVSHAGQNAVAEVAAARRPAVVVALPRPHDEQQATVDALARDGLCETVSADVSPDDVDWEALLSSAARRGGAGWARWSDGHGAHRAAAVLESAARGRRTAPRTAVVTVVHGRHDHLRGLIDGLARGTHRPERLVVVAMADPDAARVCTEAVTGTGLSVEVVDLHADPARLPLARARNVGAARAAAAGARTLIFLDVDCIPGPDLVAAYAGAIDAGPRRDIGARTPTVWSGAVTYLPPAPPHGYDLGRLPDLTDPHPARPAPPPGEQIDGDDVRLFWSLSFALTATDFEALGGFCEDYTGYGGEDTDFGMRLRQAGGSLVWLGGADAYHQYHPTQNPPVQHVADIVRNANLFAARWGRHPMEGWLAAFAEAGLARFDEADHTWVVVEGTDS